MTNDKPSEISFQIALAAYTDSVTLSVLSFENTLLAVCHLVSNSDLDQSLEVDPSVPGYLSRAVDNRTVYVPMNLAYVSPTHRAIVELSEISSSIRVNLTSHTCISGSAAFLGRTTQISDIDYAEYFEEDGIESYFREYVARERSVKFSFKACEVRMRDGGRVRDIELPFVNCSKSLAEALWRQIHIDGLDELKDVGPLPISNKVLPVQSGQISESSFVYQEIVVIDSTGGKPSRSLANQSHLKNYIEFLISESDKHLKMKPVKALKRTIALLSLLRYQADAEQGLSILESSSGRSKDIVEIRQFIDASLDNIRYLLRLVQSTG